MCRASANQSICRMANCSNPIFIEHYTANLGCDYHFQDVKTGYIRHPFCSVSCAKAGGEKPRQRSVPAIPYKGPVVNGHPVAPASPASPTPSMLLPVYEEKEKKKRSSSSSSTPPRCVAAYASPPVTPPSNTSSDDDDEGRVAGRRGRTAH
ncbi:hypothetical protein BG004_000499 [Podila humilis]|nr:hypothetical protein BG004_000499 [Podila humilis]